METELFHLPGLTWLNVYLAISLFLIAAMLWLFRRFIFAHSRRSGRGKKASAIELTFGEPSSQQPGDISNSTGLQRIISRRDLLLLDKAKALIAESSKEKA